MYITTDGLINISRNKKDEIERNYTNYINFIKNNDDPKRLFMTLCRNARRVEKNIIKNSFDQSNDIQYGGNTGWIVSGILSSFVVTATIAYLVYLWYSQKVCRPSYPLATEAPTMKDVLSKLVPADWISDSKDMNSTEYVSVFTKTLKYLLFGLKFLDRTSLGQKIGVGIGRIATSAGLVVATFGAGGDEIVNTLFDFKDILDILEILVDGLEEMSKDPGAMLFMANIFNIDFRDGPFGVDCWLNYFLKQSENVATSSVYRTICKLFRSLLDKVINFAADTISTMMPDTLGISSIILSETLHNAEGGAVKIIMDKIDEHYEQIPYDKQQLIEHPKMMKEYIDEKIQVLIDILEIPKSIFTSIIPIPMPFPNDLLISGLKIVQNNTALFALGINRFFAFIYSMLHMMEKCTNPEFLHFIEMKEKQRDMLLKERERKLEQEEMELERLEKEVGNI
ncbi:MAG: hypothetical protein Terrestrivirus2_140 [Terrestrivirus sp.]|uniref:Uncharacterized protein n=1 Tax=Terrestrivirus sp. TaxID=2487775 RepID=A0A3G4ZLB1_9VIRU|nr:MAG: hypothetical protein Terrestrivirus2_140 [Terrestrivirus sp.]